jgi:hypothetical protein
LVLLSVAGVTAFMMLSIVCLFKSEEFVRLTGENAFNAFSSFYTGGALLALNAGLGWLLVNRAKGAWQLSKCYKQSLCLTGFVCKFM